MLTDIPDQNLTFEAFPGGRYVRKLVWRSGAIRDHATPMVDTQMTSFEGGPPITILARITNWPEFRLKTICDDGRHQMSVVSFYKVEEFGAETMQIVTTYLKSLHGFPILPLGHSIFGNIRTTKLPCSQASQQAACFIGAVIQCAEFSLVYYASPSRLACPILTAAFIIESNDRIYDPLPSWLRDRVAFGQVRSRMCNADAHQIRRLAFDPFAHENAAAIVSDPITASNTGQPYALTVKRPFHTNTKLRVAGVEIIIKKNIDRSRKQLSSLLVKQILRGADPLPFHESRVERDSLGAYEKYSSSPSHQSTQFVRDRKKNDSHDAMIQEDSDSSDVDSPVPFIHYEMQPVCDLTSVTRTARYLENERRSRVRHEKMEPAETELGGAVSHGGGHTVPQLKITNTCEGNGREPETIVYFRESISGLAGAGKVSEVELYYDFSIEPLRLTKDFWPCGTWANNREVERFRLFRFAISRPRFMPRTFAIMEIERRGSEKFAPLAIQSSIGDPLPAGIFERIKPVIANIYGKIENEDRWREHQLDSVQHLSVHQPHNNTPERHAARILKRLVENGGIDLSKAHGKREKPKLNNPLDKQDGGDQRIAS